MPCGPAPAMRVGLNADYVGVEALPDRFASGRMCLSCVAHLSETGAPPPSRGEAVYGEGDAQVSLDVAALLGCGELPTSMASRSVV